MTARRDRQVRRQGYNPYGETNYNVVATPLEERRATARRALKFFARKGGRRRAKEALQAYGWTPSQIDEALRARSSKHRKAKHKRSR
jgi:hypothetical protein